MTVICPGDAWEARAALRSALKQDGPVYIRLGKKGEPLIHAAMPEFQIGKSIVMRPGSDLCLLSTGNMLPVVLDAAAVLAEDAISAQVVSFHTVKPLDVALLTEVFQSFPAVLTIEEHSRLGGLGGSVAEWLADQPQPRARLHRIGTADTFLHEAGEQEHARECFGLTVECIAAAAKRIILSGHLDQVTV
jgi:transketolase